MDSREFLGLIYDAVHSIDWPKEPIQTSQAEISPAVLRTLLTYSYATGLYCSREIEIAALAEPNVRYICAHQRPTWPIIRRFRRQNLPWLRAALLAVCERMADRLSQPVAHYSESSHSGDFASVDLTREVENRLRRAIQADSMAMDE